MTTAAPADTSPVLAIDGLTKRFGRLVALRSVSLAVRGGECLALFGRNGAGKSTLLNATATLIRTYEGAITVAGRNLRDSDETTRRAIGMVSHETYLYYDLTCEENLRFYARLYGLSDVERRVRELLARFDLEAKAKTGGRDLSRGMKQRLSLARVFLHEPRLLLLDEPFTGLDEDGCATLAAMIKGFVAEGGAVLVTTHDLDRGLDVATHAAILERGRVVFRAAGEEIDPAHFRDMYRRILGGEGVA